MRVVAMTVLLTLFSGVPSCFATEMKKASQDVVTMNSRVAFEYETVYATQADIGAGKISILVPVGSALLGPRVGQSIDWELPSGQRLRYRVIAVPYQPEAAGKPG